MAEVPDLRAFIEETKEVQGTKRSQPLRSHHSLCLHTGKHLCEYIKTIKWRSHEHWAAPLLLWSVPVTASDVIKKQEVSNVFLP